MAKSRTFVVAAAVIATAIFLVAPASSARLPRGIKSIIQPWHGSSPEDGAFGCKPTDCGEVERCIDLPFGATKCWVIDCPCKPDDEPEKHDDVLAIIAGLDKDSKWYCSDDQCDMNVTKCIDVPFKGKVCWDVTCPPCMTPKDVGLAASDDSGEESMKKTDGDDKKKFGCLPEECDLVKEVCITVPVAGDICWNVTCPACNATKPDEPKKHKKEVLTLSSLDKDSKWYCSDDQCDMNVTKCIDVPFKGKVCWDVTCPPCMTPKDEGLAATKADEESKKKDDDDKKKFKCLPKECGTTKEVCMDVPFKGEVCWDVTCPACKAPEEAQVLPLSVVEKKGDDKKKFKCLPEDCDTTKEVCMDVPFKGEVCWDVKCPACKVPEEDRVMPLSVVEKKGKKGDDKKKFKCLPEECGRTKEVCIDVPVKGKVCWDVKCPACADEATAVIYA